MTNKTLKTAFVVEPNSKLVEFYLGMEQLFNLTVTNSVPQALQKLYEQEPDVFILSTSFSLSLQIKALEAFKNSCKNKIIPLVLVIDLSKPISTIAGISWGNKLHIVNSRQSLKELKQTLEPIIR